MSRKILVVDNDMADRVLCLARLRNSQAYEYEITEAEDSDVAINLLNQYPFDCVLVDYLLPKTTGIDCIKYFQDASADPYLPVIVLTGHGDEMLAVGAMQRNAADYLPKDKINVDSLDRSIDSAITKSDLKRSVAQERNRLSDMNAELIRRNTEIQSFYQSVSHELKTPLTAIREFISLLADRVVGDINEEQEDFLKTTLQCCDRLSRLVNDLFDTARIETGKLELIPEKLDIAQLVHEIARQHETVCRKNDLSLNCSLSNNLPALQGDSVRIAQVVSNLLGNAIKFTQAGGTIDVKLSLVPTSQLIEITVADNGKGIADSDILRIFDRMYQSKSNDLIHHDGLGIGLYLSSTIAKLHGGNLAVQSREGEGSQFTLTLPLRMPMQNVARVA